MTGQCEYKEPGTTMAPCDVDADCYSGFCDETGNPGPYCFVPTSAVLGDGRAYACSSNQECADVVPEFVASGGTAICHGGDPDIYDGCEVLPVPGSAVALPGR